METDPTRRDLSKVVSIDMMSAPCCMKVSTASLTSSRGLDELMIGSDMR